MVFKKSGFGMMVRVNADGVPLCACHQQPMVQHPDDSNVWGCLFMAEQEAELRAALRAAAAELWPED